MTEVELRFILRSYGWSLSKKKIGYHFYLYAAKKMGLGNKLKEVYLCPLSSLECKSDEDIVAFIRKKYPE